MHELGYVHRCVTSYTFGLRLTKQGFLPNTEMASNVICKDAGFVRRFRSINNPPRRVAPFAGTYKYRSVIRNELFDVVLIHIQFNKRHGEQRAVAE